MDRSTVDWKGYWPASPTPFTTDGAYDAGAHTSLINHFVAAGVNGVLINGSSGEWWAQSVDERKRTAETAVQAAAGRIPVVIGCTAFTASQAIELAKHAASIGADGVLSSAPPYAHPTQSEVLGYFSDIDHALDLPLIAYNWPRGTALEISLDTARQIADLEHVVALKNSTADWPLVVDYIEALSGQVRIFASLINRRGLAIMRGLGGDGYIDGGGIGAPFAVPFFKAVWAEEWDKAMQYADQWWSLASGWITADFGGRFGSPNSQLKAAMAMLNQPGGEVRAPLQPVVDNAELRGIEDVLRSVGLVA